MAWYTVLPTVSELNGFEPPAPPVSAEQVNVPSAVTAENLSVPEQVRAVIKLKSVPSAATVSADAPLPLRTPVSEEKIGAAVKVEAVVEVASK